MTYPYQYDRGNKDASISNQKSPSTLYDNTKGKPEVSA